MAVLRPTVYLGQSTVNEQLPMAGLCRSDAVVSGGASGREPKAQRGTHATWSRVALSRQTLLRLHAASGIWILRGAIPARYGRRWPSLSTIYYIVICMYSTLHFRSIGKRVTSILWYSLRMCNRCDDSAVAG